jgi:hypothetical protein
MLLSAAVLLLSFLMGYCLGKRWGRETGLGEGKAVIPLLLRQQSCEQGYCVLCHRTAGSRDNSA